MKYGVLPTFMAKPYADQPGCSGHVHISLRNSKGENIFAVPEGEVKDGRTGASCDDTKRMSEIGEWFLAGVLMGLPDIVSFAISFQSWSPGLTVIHEMPCLVPTING